MSLSDVKIRNTKVTDKPIKLSDGQGLYLHCYPDGKKIWRYNYRWQGKQKTLTLGRYPEMTLAAARAEHQRNRSILMDATNPQNPMDVRRRAKAGAITFKKVALDWHKKHSASWRQHTVEVNMRLLERLFPKIGDRLINQIEPLELLAVLRVIEAQGHLHTAHLCRAIAGRVFRFGLACGFCERDISADLRDALAPAPKSNHLPTIVDPKRIGALMRAIAEYEGTINTRCALNLLAYTAVRQSELRRAQWSEVDLEQAAWRIPASHMKAGQEHIVLLSRQAVAILRELQPITGHEQYVFLSPYGKGRPMGKTTLGAALRCMGYMQGEMTVHGFRGMFSTRLHEMNFDHDIIELCLAHQVGNQVSRSYNHSRRLAERAKLMQSWADYIDSLRDGATVIPLHQSRAA